jgi:hypothetical protein
MKEINCETLVVQRILMIDPRGQTRISLDAGDGDGYACIGLFGNNQTLINIASEPDGACSIFLQKADSTKVVNVRISPEGEPSIVISKDGEPPKVVA